jgi:hypothetical protein
MEDDLTKLVHELFPPEGAAVKNTTDATETPSSILLETEGFGGSTTAFDLLASRILAEPHARVKLARALAGILCGDCRRRAERNPALLCALPILKNPVPRTPDPNPQAEAGERRRRIRWFRSCHEEP